jgi:hypothetical protein
MPGLPAAKQNAALIKKAARYHNKARDEKFSFSLWQNTV